MSEEFREEVVPQAEPGSDLPAEPEARPVEKLTKRSWMEILAQLGLGETVARLGTNVLTFVLVFAVIWLMRYFYKDLPVSGLTTSAQAAQPTPTPAIELAELPVQDASVAGIARTASIHTTIPNRPREEIVKYTVEAGDTLIGIGEKWGLKPQTILWGNYYILLDDPHSLKPGQELNILPVDGTYYEWQPGDGLGGVAKFFGVAPEEIISFPANKLDPTTIGDYANPNIQPGTWLIVPGGTRPFISWTVPIGATRDNPAVARQMGPGACGTILDGAVGFGSFVWPAQKHYLSGFDYSPDTNHRGIDISGSETEAAYAADAGVIVYAGWNDWGYGTMVVIDHGNGWQTLYAHLSSLSVVCGMSVGQGQIVGLIGSTGRSSGPHLHFEMMNTSYGKVNPWLYLPPP